jgi:hypothetical protein
MEMGAEEPDRLLQGKLLHSIGSEIQAKVTAALVLPVVKRRYDLPVTSEIQAVLRFLGLEDSEQNLHSREARGFWEGDLRIWSVLLGWIFMHLVGKLNQPAGNEEASRTWIDEWRLGKAFTRGLSDLALSAEEAQHLNSLLKVLTTHHDWHQKYQWMQSGRTKKLPALGAFLQDLLNDPEVLRVIKINRYQDVLWFNQEAFESLLWWLLEVAAVDLGAALETKTLSLESYIDRLALCYTAIAALGAAGIASGFQVERLVEESKTNH